VAGQMHLGLVAAGVLLLHWPDKFFASRYVSGFRSIGDMEVTGVLRPVILEACMTKEEFLADAQETILKLESQRVLPGSHRFLVEAAIKDREAGFGSALMTRSQMDLYMRGQPWKPMPRFLVQQPNGKLRAIDDGKRYGHNLATSYSETLDCCTALQPIHHVQAIVRQAMRLGIPRQVLIDLLVETGNEDLPDAYRYVPNHPEDTDVNIFGTYDEDVGQWLYQALYGMVFGKSSAVVIFHRPQRFMQSMARRWVAVLLSMYFDDASIQDFQKSKGQGQANIRELFALVGLPFASEKQVDMCFEADFLGIEHNTFDCFRTGVIPVRPRERLRNKIDTFISELLQSQRCTPAEAGKTLGMTGFAMTGYFGRVARAGQHALLQRQHWDSEPWHLSHSLERSLIFARQLAALPLERHVSIWPARIPTVIIASDGRQDESGPPSVSVLLVDVLFGIRLAWVALLPVELCERWSRSSEHYIALIEQAAVVMGLILAADYIRGRDVIWYEDNSAALSSLIKGASGNSELDCGCAVAHLSMALLRARVWFEYIESQANWADGASRLLESDPFLHREQFVTVRTQVPSWPWLTDADQRVRVLQSLFDI
jgi:hypothetical protein